MSGTAKKIIIVVGNTSDLSQPIINHIQSILSALQRNAINFFNCLKIHLKKQYNEWIKCRKNNATVANVN